MEHSRRFKIPPPAYTASPFPSSFHVYVFAVCVGGFYMCVLMYVLIHVYAPTCGSLRLMLGLLLSCSLPYSLSHGLTVEPRSH